MRKIDGPATIERHKEEKLGQNLRLNGIEVTHRWLQLPNSRPYSKLRIPAQSSSYKSINLLRREKVPMDTQERYCLVLTENDKSDEQEGAADHQEAGGGPRESLL
jgi:hypothetical protein